jgi:hypothetical protein
MDRSDPAINPIRPSLADSVEHRVWDDRGAILSRIGVNLTTAVGVRLGPELEDRTSRVGIKSNKPSPRSLADFIPNSKLKMPLHSGLRR